MGSREACCPSPSAAARGWGGSDMLGGTFESRVNHPLQGLGSFLPGGGGAGVWIRRGLPPRRRRPGGGGESGGGAGRAPGTAEARASCGFIALPARGSPVSGSPRPASFPPAAPRRPQPNLSSLPGPLESSRLRRQFTDMATPTGVPVPGPETAVSRTLLLGWVLVQMAGASGKWHPPPEHLGRAARRRGTVRLARPADRRCPRNSLDSVALTYPRLNEPGLGTRRRELERRWFRPRTSPALFRDAC